MPDAKKLRWLRKRNLVLLSGLLLVAWIGSCTYTALTAKPGPPYGQAKRLAELVLEHQPPGEYDNGWDLALRASEVLKLAESQAALELPPGGAAEPVVEYYALNMVRQYTAFAPDAAERILQRSRRAIQRFEEQGGVEFLDRAAASPRSLRPFGETPYEAIPLQNLRHLYLLSVGRMAVARDQGRDADIISAAEHALAVGRITLQQPLYLDYLVGATLLTSAAIQLREAALDGLSPETLAALLAALRRQRQHIPPPTFTARGERIHFESFIHYAHSDDGRGSGRLIPSIAAQYGLSVQITASPAGAWISQRLAGVGMLNLLSPLYASKKQVLRKHNEFFDALEVHASLPRWLRAELPDPAEIAANFSRRYIVLSLAQQLHLLPQADSLNATLDGTELLLAIELFRARSGRLPVDLAELAPSILPIVPRDPFTGQPFIYRLLPEDAGTGPGSGYLLYSTGWDGQDNNAAQHPKGLPATMSNGRGYDFVLNKRPLGDD